MDLILEPTPEFDDSVLLLNTVREPSSGEFGADFLRKGFHNLSTMLPCDIGDAEF